MPSDSPIEALDHDFDDWQETHYPTDEIAPIKLNREVTVGMMHSILTDVVGKQGWSHLDREYGDSRTETHYYNADVGDTTQRFEHHRCGLERIGNTLVFETDAPEWFKWEVAMGVFDRIVENRREDLEERPDEQRGHALNALVEEVEKLDEGEFWNLESAVETYGAARRALIRGYL
jgi:hypothetical protein